MLTDELLGRVMQHSSFSYMKNNFDAERRLFEAQIIEKIEDNQAAAERREIFMAESGIEVVRKGIINDWKSYLTPEQSEQIGARFSEICQECEGLKDFWSPWKIFYLEEKIC